MKKLVKGTFEIVMATINTLLLFSIVIFILSFSPLPIGVEISPITNINFMEIFKNLLGVFADSFNVVWSMVDRILLVWIVIFILNKLYAIFSAKYLVKNEQVK